MNITITESKFYTYPIGALVLFLMLVLNGPACAQQSNSVNLLTDPKNPTAKVIGQHVAEIVGAISRNDTWKDFSLSGNHPAIGLLNQVVDQEGVTSVRHPQSIRLLNLENDTFEVRDLYANTAYADTLAHRQLVLQFNMEGQLINAELGDRFTNVQLILDRKLWATAGQQMKVEDVARNFQQALNSRDEATIRELLAEDGLVVKGHIARYFNDEVFGPYYYYLKQSPDAYARHVQRLPGNPDIRQRDLQVFVHPSMSDVYVVTFFQSWQSRVYSDEGYVAMVVDLRGGEPLIRLRSWREAPFETGRLQYDGRYISDLAIPTVGAAKAKSDELKPVVLPTPDRPGFLEANKNWLLISAGSTAAISVGVALLTGGGKSELPGPPGRPTH